MTAVAEPRTLTPETPAPKRPQPATRERPTSFHEQERKRHVGRSAPLARRLALRSHSRFALAVGAATAIVALMILELSFLSGMLRTTDWIESTGVDIWLTAVDEPPFTEAEPVPDVTETLASVEGVRSVAPISMWEAMSLTPDGDMQQLLLFGWPPDTLEADLVSGRMPRRTGEVVLGHGFADTRDVALGDEFVVTSMGRDVPMTVVGTSRNTSMLIYQYVFTTPETVRGLVDGDTESVSTAEAARAEMERLAADLRAAAAGLHQASDEAGIFGISRTLEGTASQLEAAAGDADASGASLHDFQATMTPPEPLYLAVRADDGVDPATIAGRLERAAAVDTYPAAEFASEVRDKTVGPMLPVIYVLVFAAVIVGTLVLGMTLSTQVAESLNDYAVLLALGTTRRRLRATVARQGAIVIGMALVLGVPLGILALRSVRNVAPLLPATLDTRVWVTVVVAAFMMGLVGTMLPIRRVQRVDPVAVFRA